MDAEVPDRTLELAVSLQELQDAQVLGSPVDQRRLGPPGGAGAQCRYFVSLAASPVRLDSRVGQWVSAMTPTPIFELSGIVVCLMGVRAPVAGSIDSTKTVAGGLLLVTAIVPA